MWSWQGTKSNDTPYGNNSSKFQSLFFRGYLRFNAVYALNPQHSAFSEQEVDNLGLTGTNMYEIYQTYQYARQNQDLDLVILSLDFLAFSNKMTVSGDFHKSRFSSKSNLFAQVTEFISLY